MNSSRFADGKAEPAPGQWLDPNDFVMVVRLTPLVSIDIVVKSRDGRILVGRRKHEPAKNLLFVPGGRITKNETRAAAFRRLTKTELGREINLEQAQFLGVYDHIYARNRLDQPGFGTHYVVLGYELDLGLEWDSLPTDQHGEYLWLTPAEILASAEVHENTKAYFRQDR